MVKAALAKEERFFYTFIKKESRQRRHSGMCGGADADAGKKVGEKADMSTNFWELLRQRQEAREEAASAAHAKSKERAKKEKEKD